MTESSDTDFEADDGLGPLEHRAARSGAMMISSRIAQLVLGLGTTMILARILRPEDFGLIAMAGVLFGAALSLKNMGLGLAIVQQERVEEAELSKLFWLSLAFTSALAIITAALGPLIAWFFNEPVLVAITGCMAVGVFISGFVNIHDGLAQREMRFGGLSIAEIVAAISGAVIAISLAWLGFGVWALVAQQLVILIVQTMIVWNLVSFRPGPVRLDSGLADIRGLLAFGGQTAATRLINELSEQFSRVLLGRLAGPAALGVYQMAHRWSALPALQLVVPMKNVSVAAFSRLQGDLPRYRAYARLSFVAVLSLALPVLAFFVASAPSVIHVLLGSQWTEAIPIFRILCAAVFMGCAGRTMIWVYLSEGRTASRLRWTLVSRPIFMLFVAGGVPWGAVGIASGYALGKAVLSLHNVYHCLRDSPLTHWDFYSAAGRPAIAAIVAAAAIHAFGDGSIGFVQLCIQALGFSAIYGAIWLGIPGGPKTARAMIEWLRAR